MQSLYLMNSAVEFTPSDFVAVVNQTLEYAYPSVAIVGELSGFRVNKWVYADVKDDTASVKCFGTVYALPGPLEDGMMVRVVGRPRLNPRYGFSLLLQSITPVGEGTLKRAVDLLEIKLTKEGLFDEDRKRTIAYPPQRVGLITSEQSAAYRDFITILSKRWGGIEVHLADVQVQGDAAPKQVVAAIEYFNRQEQMDVIVVTRGGGGADDLAAFNAEAVVRAVAASRTPTIVAIGHERDVSLAELAADLRASTPSNAAELLTPDKQDVLERLGHSRILLGQYLDGYMHAHAEAVALSKRMLTEELMKASVRTTDKLRGARHLLMALDPAAPLRRGYAVVKVKGRMVRSVVDVPAGTITDITFTDGTVQAEVQS